MRKNWERMDAIISLEDHAAVNVFLVLVKCHLEMGQSTKGDESDRQG